MTGSAQIDPGQLPERVEALPGIDALREVAERVPAYLVGGAVRDLLLGLEGGELDVAIEGDADALADLPGFESAADPDAGEAHSREHDEQKGSAQDLVHG